MERLNDYRIRLMLVVFVAAVVFGGGSTHTVGATSSGEEEFAYVRIFSAEIPDGIGKPLDELKAITREHGSEEIAMFPKSLGPEAQEPYDRWIVRAGTERYASPGLTVKSRTYLSEQIKSERQNKTKTLSISKNKARYVQVLPKMNARLEWTLPDSIRSPLQYSITRDNKLLATNTIYEQLSPYGQKHWPTVVRVDLPQKNASIIQIFEYLDKRPDDLSSIQDRLYESLLDETMVAESVEEPLAGPLDPGGMEALYAISDDYDFVEFDYHWGFNYSYDSGWVPGGPVQIKLKAGAAADIDSTIVGDFQFNQQSETAGLLQVGSGRGGLEMDFGAWLKTRGKIDLGIWDKKFDLPFVPNFNLRCKDSTSFNSYLLDYPASISDSTSRQTLFAGRLGIDGASISAELQAAITMSGTLTVDSISTDDGKRFTSEGQSLSVSLFNGIYDEQVTLNEDATGKIKITFYPSLCGEILGFRRCLNVASIPWTVWEGDINFEYSKDRLTFGGVPASGIIYVDADAPGPTHDGSSWDDAYKYLSQALGAASGGDEIWVAQGVYMPPASALEEMWGVPRRAAFALKDSVQIKGGYAGYGEEDPYARDVEAYETILSGDIGVVGDDTDNCYHVVRAFENNFATVLDGFTITGGNADGGHENRNNCGGGMLIDVSNPTVINCTFRGNYAKFPGGGIYNYFSNSSIIGCTFSENSAQYGGGIDITGYNDLTLTNCTFIDNEAEERGGGINNDSCIVTITNCKFLRNSAKYGGGINSDDGALILTNCLLGLNDASFLGGGIYSLDHHHSPDVTYAPGPALTVTNCTIAHNTDDLNCAGIYCVTYYERENRDPIVNNCILWGNGWYYIDIGGNVTPPTQSNQTNIEGIRYSCIQGWDPNNVPAFGTGNIGKEPNFITSYTPSYPWEPLEPFPPRAPILYNNIVDDANYSLVAVPTNMARNIEGLDLSLRGDSPCIDAGNNNAVPSGVTTDLDGNLRFVDVTTIPDTGIGSYPFVDMGAYEFGSGRSCYDPPAPPAVVTAIQGSEPGEIVLTWSPSACATGYKIFYDHDANNPPFSPVPDGKPASGSDVGDVFHVTISGLTHGENYCFAVKAYNDAGESAYSYQNCTMAGIEACPPDLMVSQPMQWDFSPETLDICQSSKQLKIVFAINNNGCEESGQFDVCFYASRDQYINSSDYLLDSGPLSLGPGQSCELSIVVELNPGDLPSGAYYIGAIIDCDDDVIESNEGNNVVVILDKQLTILPCDGGPCQPDLMVSQPAQWDFSPETLDICQSSQPMGINFEIKNTGCEDSGQFWLAFYASRDQYISTSDYLLYRILFSLASGQSIMLSVKVELDPGDLPSGTYYIGAIIDCEDDVRESNENNNVTVIQHKRLEISPCQSAACSYEVGDRVVLLVNNPREVTNLPAGTCGTVLCIDSSDPEFPVLVSWDRWAGGYNIDQYCDTQPPRYPNNSAYWMACDDIAPGCTEGYFDKCGVFVRAGDCVFFDADGGGRYHVYTYDFQVGDRVRVRGLLVHPCLTVVCGPPDGCIEYAIVSYCDEIPSSCCSPPYSPGDRIRLLVSNPTGAVGLPAGTYGTVLCCDSDDPDIPIFVSWDGWNNGWDKDEFCDIPPGPYPPDSGWWMTCDQVAALTEQPETACCDPHYSPGDLVKLLVSYPRGAVGLETGKLGIVICCDSDDPDYPIFVSWDNWRNGSNSDQYCDTTTDIYPYPADSGWWMACDEIEPPGPM